MPHHPRQRRKLFSAHAETTPTKLSEKSRERSARDESVTATKDESGTSSERVTTIGRPGYRRDQTVRFAFAKEVFVISNKISRAGDERETNAQVHELVRTESRTVG